MVFLVAGIVAGAIVGALAMALFAVRSYDRGWRDAMSVLETEPLSTPPVLRAS